MKCRHSGGFPSFYFKPALRHHISTPVVGSPCEGSGSPCPVCPRGARFRPEKLECVALLQGRMPASISGSNRSHALSPLRICLRATWTAPQPALRPRHASFACLKSFIISTQRTSIRRLRAQPPVGAAWSAAPFLCPGSLPLSSSSDHPILVLLRPDTGAAAAEPPFLDHLWEGPESWLGEMAGSCPVTLPCPIPSPIPLAVTVRTCLYF